MRQLDSCDFCGSTPEGVFEVVPASVAGDARRLALCADCRETLQSVTDPLLAAARAGKSGDANSEEAGDVNSEEAGGANSEEAGDASHELDATPTGEADEPDESASSDDTATTGDAESSHRRQADSPSEQRDGESSEQSDTESTEQRKRKPEGYAQVVRLLQNRDGAMPREDLRTLATNAYDLGERQFEDAVDAAIENGDVQETSDGLQTKQQ